MKQDHYSVLGVAPASEQAVIRAAYRALMRRYHPDADPGDEAAERARAINAAYAVLGNPEKRASYDESIAAQRKIRFEPAYAEVPVQRGGSRFAPVAAIGFAVLAAGMVAFAISPPSGPLPAPALPFGARPSPTWHVPLAETPAPEARTAKPAASPEPASREPDPPEAIEPLRIAAAEVAAKGRPPREAAPAPAPVRPSALTSKKAPAAAVERKAADAQRSQASSACAATAGRAERMICGDSNLSSLDRQLTMFYRQSWNQADERKRAALLGTRQRFNDRRDSCVSPGCLTTAYVSRLKEISDIMAGRAKP